MATKKEEAPVGYSVMLDKERALLFTMPAISRLDEVCKINLFSPETYDDMSPSKVVSLVWAGQLHTKGALTRSEVERHIPVQPTKYWMLCQVVAKAVRDALKDDTAPAK